MAGSLCCLHPKLYRADCLLGRASFDVAIIGAGSRAEFREEDQLCCAWIAEGLYKMGYEPENARTISIIEQWSGVSVDTICNGASAEYLRNSGQSRDLEYILAHIDDLNEVYRYEHGQVVEATAELLLH